MKSYRVVKHYETIKIQKKVGLIFKSWRFLRDSLGDDFSFSTVSEALDYIYHINDKGPAKITVLKEVLI